MLYFTIYFNELTTKWRSIVSWHNKVSSASSIYRL